MLRRIPIKSLNNLVLSKCPRRAPYLEESRSRGYDSASSPWFLDKPYSWAGRTQHQHDLVQEVSGANNTCIMEGVVLEERRAFALLMGWISLFFGAWTSPVFFFGIEMEGVGGKRIKAGKRTLYRMSREALKTHTRIWLELWTFYGVCWFSIAGFKVDFQFYMSDGLT